jgi:hypothetical protein
VGAAARSSPRPLARWREWGGADAAPAVVAFLVLVIRAHQQSITIDEAADYLAFVRHAPDALWMPNSANHVLYSVLELFTTSAFGLNQFTVRLPALLGGALYLTATIGICRRVMPERISRVVFIAAMSLNPLILDYLVAARGYSLALGFLLMALWAVTIVLDEVRSPGPLHVRQYRLTAAASIGLGLAVCANFSFASVASILGLLFVILVRLQGRLRLREFGRLVLATAAPGTIVLYLVCGYTVLHWPAGQLVYGSQSVGELIRSIVDSSLWQPNPDILQPQLLTMVGWIRAAFPYLLLAVLGLCLAQVIHRTARTGRLPRPLAMLAFGTVIATVGIHAILFALGGVLMPKGRTASYIVPLMLVGLAALTGEQPHLRLPRSLRVRPLGAITAAVAILAGLNVCSLRLSYFEEWQFDADTGAAYKVMAAEAQRLHVSQPVVNVLYGNSMNFYRAESDLPPVDTVFPPYDYPVGRGLYVLFGPGDATFIAKQHLKIVFTGPLSGVVVAESAS